MVRIIKTATLGCDTSWIESADGWPLSSNRESTDDNYLEPIDISEEVIGTELQDTGEGPW